MGVAIDDHRIARVTQKWGCPDGAVTGMSACMTSVLPSCCRVWVAAIATLVTILPACADFDEPGENRVVGARGYTCVANASSDIASHIDTCATNLFCLEIEGAFVCSGPQDEGQSCYVDDDCQYRRNDLGLPLFCDAGSCRYPSPLEPAAP